MSDSDEKAHREISENAGESSIKRAWNIAQLIGSCLACLGPGFHLQNHQRGKRQEGNKQNCPRKAIKHNY